MKRITLNLLLAVSLMGSGAAFAQKGKVNTALYKLDGDETVGEAKEAIDMAASNPETANMPFMWFVRGKVYQRIAKSGNEAVRSLDADAAWKSAESYRNFFASADKKSKTDLDEAYDLAPEMAAECYNLGISAKDAKEYDKAYRYLNLCTELIAFDGHNLLKDQLTTNMVNLAMFGVAAAEGSADKQIVYLKKLVDANYNDPQVHVTLARIYFQQKDETNGLAVLENAKVRFPDSRDVLIEEINYYIGKGDAYITQLLDKVNTAIENDPGNGQLYYVRGNIYDRNKNSSAAEADYVKALDMNENLIDAAWNLVHLYTTEIDSITNANRSLSSSDARYVAGEKRKDDLFGKCKPYCEKAIDNTDYAINDRLEMAKILKKVYLRLGEQDKAKSLDATIADLKAQAAAGN